MKQKPYVAPAIETLDSNEIVELIGPVQGYGPGNVGGGVANELVGGITSPGGSVTPSRRR